MWESSRIVRQYFAPLWWPRCTFLMHLLYRRMDLLNMAALSALVILIARPLEITDASFLLSFSAVGIIGALAVPWIAESSEPYRRGLDHLGDVTGTRCILTRRVSFSFG